MPTVRLTVRGLEALRPAQDRTDYFDESLPGFCVRVSSSGAKSFAVMYRFAGRLRRLTLGSHPPLGLADARELARDALRKAALGKDPAAEKLGLRTADSFEELAVRYMERHAKVKKRSWREDQRVIDKHLLPKWRNVRARDITRRDVIALLDGIADNTPILANRIRAQISKMFNWATSRDLVDHNPCHQVPRPGQEHRRDRVLTEDEIKRLWKALDGERLITAATSAAPHNGAARRRGSFDGVARG